jgi:hypothetical protein
MTESAVLDLRGNWQLRVERYASGENIGCHVPLRRIRSGQYLAAERVCRRGHGLRADRGVQRYSRAKAPITPPSDKLLRLIVKGHYSGQVTVRRAIDALNHRDQEGHAARLVFQEADKKWKSVG